MVTRSDSPGTAAPRLRRWWPVPVVIAASVIVQEVAFMSRYDVSGHARGHLAGASAPFFAFALIAILLYVTPRARRRPLVLVACAAWFVSTVCVLVGNVRVVDALIDAGLERVPTSEIVVEGPVAAAHSLADAAPWWAVATSIAVVVALFAGRQVSRRVAIGAGVLSVVFPPWIIPGAGMIVLVIARGLAFEREP